MGATDPWTDDDRPDEARATVPSDGRRGDVSGQPWVAAGGWRRAVVGTLTGLVAGLMVRRWVERD